MPGFLSTCRNLKDWILQYPLVVIVLFCFITRLPQLIGPQLMLDPDECVTAIMAKHFMNGDDFSLFFWGQKYGLTIFESAIIVPFYLVLGINTIAVKLAMLSLWTIGVIFLYKTLLAISHNDKLKSLLFTLVFISLPAWAIWSMKARGGYLTSFVLSSAIVYILFNKNSMQKTFAYLLLGVIIELVYESQVLWLIGIIPLLIYSLTKQSNYKKISLLILTFFTTFFLLKYYKTSILYPYTPPISLPDIKNTSWYLLRFPEYLYNSLGGQYYFFFYQPINLVNAIISIITVIVLFILTATGIVFIIKRKWDKNSFIFSTLFFWGFLLFNFFTYKQDGRYLLPISQFTLLSLYILINSDSVNKKISTILVSIILIGSIGMCTFWNFEFEPNKKKEVQDIVTFLSKNNIRNAFTMDCPYPWFLMFYSNEKIIARMPYYAGRSLAICDAVNNNWRKGEKTALLNYAYMLPERDKGTVTIFNNFYVKINPSKEEIESQFQFK
ncbi:MAG: hypothetical protein V4561_06800 [Bacteroidota bacterium]